MSPRHAKKERDGVILFEEATVITGSGIKLFKFLSRKGALELETKGLKRRGRSAYAICKEVYNLTGTKSTVLVKMDKMLEEINEKGIDNVIKTER